MNLSDAEFIKLDGSIIIRIKLDGYIVYKSTFYAPYEFRNSDIVEVRTTTTKVNKANDNLSYMFSGCDSLASVDVSSWNTSNVTNMSYMFSSCYSLTTLNLNYFDTSKVEDMSYMFNICNSLASVDVSGWDTSNVTDMNSMFNNCSSLTSLDLSSFDTSNVTDMSYMFNNCSNLTSLDLSSFDTSNVTHMWGMFRGCSKLTSLDLRKWDLSKIFNMYYLEDMLDDCNKLYVLRLDNCSKDTISKIITHSSLPTGKVNDVPGVGTTTRKLWCRKINAPDASLLPDGWEFIHVN